MIQKGYANRIIFSALPFSCDQKVFCKSGVIGRLLGAVVDTESPVGTGASVTVVLCTRMTGHINIFIHIFGTVLVLGGIV